MKKFLIISTLSICALFSQRAEARIDVGINLGGPAYVEPAPAYVEQPIEPAYVVAPDYRRYNRHYHYDRRYHTDHWHRR